MSGITMKEMVEAAEGVECTEVQAGYYLTKNGERLHIHSIQRIAKYVEQRTRALAKLDIEQLMDLCTPAADDELFNRNICSACGENYDEPFINHNNAECS